MARQEALRDITLGQQLDETVRNFPDREALVYPDLNIRYTYREYGAAIDRIAKGFMAMGVGKGDKIAFWASNVPIWMLAQFAAAKIGAILVAVNTAYRIEEVRYLLTHSEAKFFCLTNGFRRVNFVDTIYALAPELLAMERGKLRCADLPHLEKVIFLGPEKRRGMYSLPELASLGRMVGDQEYRARQESVSPHDIAYVQYTSGTTGTPKGALLTHHGVVNNAYWIGAGMKFSEKERLCMHMPLFHCFGSVVGNIVPLCHGATEVLLEYYDPLKAMNAIDKEKCTVIYGVPTMYIGILEHPDFGKYDFSSLRTGMIAGATCSSTTVEAITTRMHMPEIMNCYGLTEISSVATMSDPDVSPELKAASAGKAIPGVRLGIFDPETGLPLPPNEDGEVCIHGYGVMKGYYKDPRTTGLIIDRDGWLHTGDQGRLDENGYLYITGRVKDMIIQGGENISPQEIEEFIYRMDGVIDVQVVAVPSRRYGEQVGAFVRLKPGVSLTAKDIKAYCRGRIAHYKIPKHVFFVEEFPLTANGKVQKFKLREAAARLVQKNGAAGNGGINGTQ